MKLKYGLDDKPRFGATMLYGLQWFMICIPVVLTSTFIAPAGEMVFFTQKMFAVMGITIILQALWGHRMPLIAGPAAALLMGVLTARTQGFTAEAIYPSMIIGGALLTLTAVSGLMGKIQRLFTPRIVVSILLLIAFTIAKPIIGLIFSNHDHQLLALLFALIGVPLMACANNLLRGIAKTMVVIVAMIAGSLLYYCITGFPTQLMSDSIAPRLFVGSVAALDAGLVLSFIFCYIALIINEVGSVQSLGEMVGADKMGRRNKWGMGLTGIMNMAAGAVGVLGPIDYSLSPGVVASTSCASRYTILPAAVLMVLLAFWPNGVAVLLTIPEPVMGVVLLFLMCTQVAAGLTMMQGSQAALTFRDGMVLGVPIMFNIMLSFAPQEAIAAIPALARPIVGNGFVMGIIAVLIVEHIVLRQKPKQ